MTVCVCIPARDEEESLPRLLDALAAQDCALPLHVAVCLNNTSDRSAEIVRSAVARHAGRLTIHWEERLLPWEQDHAGGARRAAMALGLSTLELGSGVLISTDADSRPPPHWVSANLAAIATGADLVGGRLDLDEAEMVPPRIHAAKADWDAYWETVRAIEDAIDPRSGDPPPRHGDHTGASLAITATLYRRVGGVPLLPTGEDRALVAAAVEAGGRLRHPPDVWTRVSARRKGRAAGGMAAFMSELDAQVAAGRPALAPSFAQWRERAAWRLQVRNRLGDAAVAALEAELQPMRCDMQLRRQSELGIAS